MYNRKTRCQRIIDGPAPVSTEPTSLIGRDGAPDFVHLKPEGVIAVPNAHRIELLDRDALATALKPDGVAQRIGGVAG